MPRTRGYDPLFDPNIGEITLDTVFTPEGPVRVVTDDVRPAQPAPVIRIVQNEAGDWRMQLDSKVAAQMTQETWDYCHALLYRLMAELEEAGRSRDGLLKLFARKLYLKRRHEHASHARRLFKGGEPDTWFTAV